MIPFNKAVTFHAGREIISGRIVSPDVIDFPLQVLFLHGAGGATKDRALPIASKLAESGIRSLGFDFSGHGASSGNLGQSSLQKRVLEANAALSFGQFDVHPSVFAFSMGAHIALKLLTTRQIGTLILFYPAVYDKEVYSIPFADSRFTDTIRIVDSWKRSDVFDLLAKFTGNLLIVTGENDDVIPPGVIRMLDESSRRTKNKRIITITGATHLLIPALLANKALFSDVCTLALQYIMS